MAALPRGCLLLASGLAGLGFAGAYNCGDHWPTDFCDGATRDLVELPAAPEGRRHGACTSGARSGSGTSGCTPYAKPPPPGTDWLAVRRRLVAALFGNEDGTLPTRTQPDEVVPLNHEQTFGNCVCASQQTCDKKECTAPTNVTKLVWRLEVPVNASFSLKMNATAFHSLNTSGVAPDNEVGPEAKTIWPNDPLPARGISDTLVVYHNGHTQPCTLQGCDTDHDGVVDWLNRMGYDTMHLQMPLYQCNYQEGIGCDHEYFTQFDREGALVFRFFLEPVVLAINYAMELGYKQVVMAGLSGGGWTTTLLAAIDPRISLSIPVAGSIPCDFWHNSWDFEQYCDNKWAMVANYTSLYVLAALEPSRHSLQIIHEADPCCFHACHRHERIRAYNDWVRSQVAGNFATAATIGNVHEVNDRDKVLIGTFIEKHRQGQLAASDFVNIPFTTLMLPDTNNTRPRAAERESFV